MPACRVPYLSLLEEELYLQVEVVLGLVLLEPAKTHTHTHTHTHGTVIKALIGDRSIIEEIRDGFSLA